VGFLNLPEWDAALSKQKSWVFAIIDNVVFSSLNFETPWKIALALKMRPSALVAAFETKISEIAPELEGYY